MCKAVSCGVIKVNSVMQSAARLGAARAVKSPKILYGDTDQNLRHNVSLIAPPSHAPSAAAIGRSWRLGRLSLPMPLPSLPPRFAGAFPYPHPLPQMLIGICQTAQPLFGCRAARSRFFTPWAQFGKLG